MLYTTLVCVIFHIFVASCVCDFAHDSTNFQIQSFYCYLDLANITEIMKQIKTFSTTPLKSRILSHAAYPQTPVSLRQLVQFGLTPSLGTLARASLFLREELPIRLSHRAVELDHLPNNLANMKSIKKVRDWYATSFCELTEFPHLKVCETHKSQYTVICVETGPLRH